MTDLEAAWAAVHDATPPVWYVRRPSYDDHHRQWSMYAFTGHGCHGDRRHPNRWLTLSEPLTVAIRGAKENP